MGEQLRRYNVRLVALSKDTVEDAARHNGEAMEWIESAKSVVEEGGNAG